MWTKVIIAQFSVTFPLFGSLKLIFGLDFLGFGSKRRSALQLLDKTLDELKVNPAYLDNGLKYVIYKWVIEEEKQAGSSKDTIDYKIREAAALLSFCIIGAEETERLWGLEARSSRELRLNAVLEHNKNDTIDANLIKLVLAKGLAAPDIRMRVELD